MITQAVVSSVLLASMILLLPTVANAAIEGSDLTKFGLYRVRNWSICAAVINTGRKSSLDDSSKTPDPQVMFGNAQKLPLSECRRTRDFVVVHNGRYAFLSASDVVASLIGRNYSYTFCVNSEHRVDFSCYKNGETYFVAPTDYDRVLIRGPVGFYTCPQTYEALYGEFVSLIGDERQCATFLTVSSYGVRTDRGDCVHLFRYAQFKEYPEVWNGCQRYAKDATANASYDCLFGASPEPWNYPTRDEVSRCAIYAPRVACSSLQSDAAAGARYFYPGRGVGEMTQNKMDNRSCQSFNIDDLFDHSDSFAWLGGSHHYARTAAIGGGGIVLVVFVLVARIMCRMFLCASLCRREPVHRVAVVHSTVTAAQPVQMRGTFSTAPSDVPYGRLHDV